MIFNPIDVPGAQTTEVRLSNEELLFLKRLLAKTTMTASALAGNESACAQHLIEIAERIYRFRRCRDGRAERDFGQGLFADPAWDMLLDLYIHNLRGIGVTISNACHGASAPPTTALRHLAELERRGIVTRRPHPSDRRVLFAYLTHEGTEMMASILNDFARLFSSASPAREETIETVGN